MKEKEVARKSDLKGHQDQDWRVAHGIWQGISDPAVSILQSKAKFRAYLSTEQNDLATGWVKVLCDGSSFNPGSHYSKTNKKFTAPVSGYYQFNAGASLTRAIDNQDYYLAFYVDGAAYVQSKRISSYDFAFVGLGLSDIIYVAASSYVELYVYNGGGATTVDLVTGSLETFFSGHILSVA